MKISAPLTFLILNPAGIRVRGQHATATLSVHPELRCAFAERHADWHKVVRVRHGAFDGERAALLNFYYEQGILHLRTAYRSYTEGLALRDCLHTARREGRFQNLAVTPARPCADISWGMSLNCYVLLPQNHVLCAKRDARLICSPAQWTCSHTEVMEPTDIHAIDMQPLLERLVAEEMPALRGLGTQKFVGLGLRNDTYGWQLIGLVDLRRLDPVALAGALGALKPDDETSEWAVCPLDASSSSAPYSEVIRLPAARRPLDVDVAQFLDRAIPVD